MSMESERSGATGVSGGGREIVVVQAPQAGVFSRLKSWFLMLLLVGSLLANMAMYSAYHEYFAADEGPTEKFHSGDRLAGSKIALLRVSGMIMPPFTGRLLKTIDHVAKDDDVKGVLLSVDSPGGLVSDSHQIYHRLKELRDKHRKPIVVSMGSIAASGGYYIAMGAGPQAKIYAEPTTWTGSIGVIIPRYEVAELAQKLGVKSAPLKTGEFKDTLSPFRDLSEREKTLWTNILDQSFDQFLEVIDEGRGNLDKQQVRELATGQIFTAKDAKANGLIDEIGYEEDALAALKQLCGLTEARVVTYQHAVSLAEILSGSAQTPDATAQWRALLEASVPRAMYFCSWGLPLPRLPELSPIW